MTAGGGPTLGWLLLLQGQECAPRDAQTVLLFDESSALARTARRQVHSPRCEVDARGTGTGIAYFDAFV